MIYYMIYKKHLLELIHPGTLFLTPSAEPVQHLHLVTAIPMLIK